MYQTKKQRKIKNKKNGIWFHGIGIIGIGVLRKLGARTKSVCGLLELFATNETLRTTMFCFVILTNPHQTPLIFATGSKNGVHSFKSNTPRSQSHMYFSMDSNPTTRQEPVLTCLPTILLSFFYYLSSAPATTHKRKFLCVQVQGVLSCTTRAIHLC